MATSDANGANGAKGRPSLPDYLPQENLAIALAAQKASMKPDQTGSELEAGTKELYAAMLREVQATYTWLASRGVESEERRRMDRRGLHRAAARAHEDVDAILKRH